MELLQSLGVNQSVFFQFVIFGITFFALIEIAFKPYAAAHQQRENNTKGSIDNVAKLENERATMMSEYETKARELNGEIKKIFDANRDQARAEAERLVTQARGESNQALQQTREKVQTQVGEATRKAQEEIPALAQAMVKKLLA